MEILHIDVVATDINIYKILKQHNLGLDIKIEYSKLCNILLELRNKGISFIDYTLINKKNNKQIIFSDVHPDMTPNTNKLYFI